MSTAIKLRGDTTANWNINNPLLLEREIVVDTTLNRFKIGDGVTTIAFPIALAILVLSFITTLIYVRKANGEFEDLTNEIKKDVKDLI